MIGITTIDKYILKSYLGTLASFFFILMFIFIIQTVWVFIDEFAGKGLNILVLFKFLIFYSPKLIPLVLPLTILLSSIMTFGGFAEKQELSALKSAGISLSRAMRPLIVVNFFAAFLVFYITNTVIPLAEYKTFNLRKNLSKVQPALAITEGMFNDIGEINIKVEKKYGENDRFLEDIIIHENSADQVNRVVIKSKKGELKNNDFQDGIQLILFDGYRYEEVYSKKKTNKSYPHNRVYFEKYTKNIDLSSFNNVDLNEELEFSNGIGDALKQKEEYTFSWKKTIIVLLLASVGILLVTFGILEVGKSALNINQTTAESNEAMNVDNTLVEANETNWDILPEDANINVQTQSKPVKVVKQKAVPIQPVVKEVPKQPVKVVSSSTNKKVVYRVIAGSYSNYNNAQMTLDRIKKLISSIRRFVQSQYLRRHRWCSFTDHCVLLISHCTNFPNTLTCNNKITFF